MSDITKQKIVKTLIESEKLTRLEQLFPNVFYKTNFAKDIGWNPSTFSERMEKPELFDMKAVRTASEFLEITPVESFLLLYNQYMHSQNEPDYKGDSMFDMKSVKKLQELLKITPVKAFQILYNRYQESLSEPPLKEEK